MVALLDSKKLRTVFRVLVLIAGLVTIVRWQRGFQEPNAKFDYTHRLTAPTGLNEDKKFFFYLWHLGLYPLATKATIGADTKEEAKRLLREAPKDLVQDIGTTFRSGDRGRTFLYFVDAWQRHDAVNPSVKPANRMAFTFALCALFFSAWAIGWTLRGALLVAVLGSNPFQLFSTYVHENIFSWSITTMILFLAIHLPLFERRRKVPAWYPWAAAIATGLLMAAIKNFRSDPTTMLASVALIYLTMTWRTWKQRALYIAVMFACLQGGTRASVAFLEHKFKQTAEVVTKVGGSAYPGPREYAHEFWHPVWCGLGDFDTKYGYEWQDLTAYRYTLPMLQRMHPDTPFVPYLIQTYYWDQAKVHPVMFFETPGYHELIRKKVLTDIRRDPKWYLDILEKRAERIFERTSAVGLATSQRQFYLSGGLLGILCLPLLLGLLLTRRWTEVKLLLWSTPLSLPAFIIYSDGGMTFFGTFQHFGLFLLVVLAAEALLATWKKRGRGLVARLVG